MRDSKQSVTFSLFILSFYYGIAMAVDSLCGSGWEPYKDEKCFKIFEGLQTYFDAEVACQGENSTSLIFIRSREEQDFISNFLYKTHGIVDTVWIGAKINSNRTKFEWADHSDLSYSNWASGSPQNQTGYDCVQMIPEAVSRGKWTNEPCNKKNLVVCQKVQTWSLAQVQKIVMDLVKNPVPIGFIYVQLSGQPKPETLWSMVEWKDVTSEYAGHFFRAEGGGSAVFGQSQKENSPRLVAVTSEAKYELYDNKTLLNVGETSKVIYTGDSGSSNGKNYGLSFEVSGGEVRPLNKAVRIWKRTN